MSFEQDIDRATRQLTNLDKVIKTSLLRAAAAGAGELTAEAINRTPVRTGKLRRSYGDRPGTASERTAVGSGVHLVFNSAFYASAVEHGRYKRPFMRPAAAASKGKMLAAMERAVTREANKVL